MIIIEKCSGIAAFGTIIKFNVLAKYLQSTLNLLTAVIAM